MNTAVYTTKGDTIQFTNVGNYVIDERGYLHLESESRKVTFAPSAWNYVDAANRKAGLAEAQYTPDDMKADPWAH